MGRFSAGIVVCVMLLCGAASGIPPAHGAPAAEPLRQEDVVRLHVSGMPAAELIQLIRERDVEFDVSEEMGDELRHAGLPPEVIQAMVKRQAELMRDKAEPAQLGDGPTLRVVFRGGKGRLIRVYDSVDPPLALRWDLGNAPEERRFTDVAIFLACRTPSHVPDQWQVHGALRWDAEHMPRHELLAFASGAERTRTTMLARFRPTVGTAADADGPHAVAGGRWDGTKQVRGILELEVPPALEARLAPGEEHDLCLGLALKIGEAYYPWSIVALDGVTLGSEDLELEGRVTGQGTLRIDALGVDFARPGARGKGGRKIVVRGSSSR